MQTVNAEQLSAANWERTGDGRQGANLPAINWQSQEEIFFSGSVTNRVGDLT